MFAYHFHYIIKLLFNKLNHVYVLSLVINIPYMTKYHNDNPKRKESGTYKITAVNKFGQDTAEVEITVTCKQSTTFT